MSALDRFVNATHATVYKSGAAQLIRETIGVEPRDQTFLIHVARWSDGGEIAEQNWYVYHSGQWTDGQFTTQKRIYGRNQVWFLYLQLNSRSNGNITYSIQTQKKALAVFTHLQQAAGLFGVNIALPAMAPGEARNVWNAELVNIPYVPSNVVITPQFSGGAAGTFDDEGLSWVDFSAAVPVSKTNAPEMFAVADLYFRPVDIKGLGFGSWPHAVEGVRVGSRPLKNILVGVGWGPMYAGVVMGGGTRTFSFGVNISISAAVSGLKK